MNAELIANYRTDGAYAIITGNYAIASKISISEALAIESVEGMGATAYANVLAVKEGNENHPKTIALKEALLTSTTREFILNKFKDSVIPLF
jgi:D-methionine transport system substrate-binding protein